MRQITFEELHEANEYFKTSTQDEAQREKHMAILKVACLNFEDICKPDSVYEVVLLGMIYSTKLRKW